MRRSPVSAWMHSRNYGRALASRAARYSARYYRIIIAIVLSTLLILEARHAHPLLVWGTWGGITLYTIYLLVRLHMSDRWTARYYAPLVQFARAQIGIAGFTFLLFCYAAAREQNLLWILYILALMIVSEHCSTSAMLMTVGWIGILLIGLGYVGRGGTLSDYLYFSAEFTRAVLEALVILLLGFLLHYLVRNVGARDTTIARYRKMLDHLASNIRSLHDPRTARTLVLNLLQTTHSASCGTIWIPDVEGERLILAACARVEDTPHPDCPAAHTGFGFSIPLTDERLPACVARTQRRHFASRADHPPRQLEDAIAAPRPFLPHARLELGIPIPDFRPHRAASRAVLCLAFERRMSHDEMRQEYHTFCEMVHHLTPVLYYASLLEQYQALQRLGQMVTHSLDHDHVLNTLLELVTDVFGFDFATVSLVDQDEGVIRTVCGRNADWTAIHSLDGNDIQADVIRTGETEILTGWDERFDRRIWEKFDHQDVVRVFVPMTVADPVTGSEERIGTLEAGYRSHRGSYTEPITREQVNLLHPFVDQAAAAVANAHLYNQIRAKAKALTALHHGGQAIQSAVWQFKRLLEEIGRRAQQVLGADIVSLFEYDEDRHRADLTFIGGDVWGKGAPSPRLDEGNILDAIIEKRGSFYFADAQNEALLVEYGDADGHRRRTFTQRQKIASFAGVPLLSGEELLGIMCVNYRTRNHFSQDQRRLIELFAQQATTALESAHLRKKEQKLIVARERTAFSRELHHSVSHDLFAVALKARTVLQHPDVRDADVIQDMNDILETAERANRQVGYLISEFSTLDLTGENFCSVIRESVARIRRYYDIDIDLCCDGGSELDLSPQMHFALSRIVKEALNNTIHHSRCRHIKISCILRREEQELLLEITDDGVGFDLQRALNKEGKFGLGNMQEYARSVGCRLELYSAPKQGTRISACVPLNTSL